MSSSDKVEPPPPPPAATAGAETAALNAQVLKAGNTENNRVVELTDETTDDAGKTKKPSQAGLGNYFVSCTSVGVAVDYLLTFRPACLYLWYQIRLRPDYSVLPYVDRIWHCYATNEHCLRWA